MINEKNRFYGKTKELSIEELKHLFSSESLSYIKIALLFGSRALGRSHERSDYDFALLFEDDPEEAWGMLAKAWGDIGSEFGLDEIDYDLIDLSHATDEMKSSIKKGYMVLKGDEDDISRVLG